MIIRNGPELTSKGNISGRKVVINVIENALEQVNSYNLVKNLVTVSQKDLRMGSLAYDLDEIESIYVIGGGKQVTYVSAALEDVLGDRIREGVVVEKRGWGRRTGKISVIDGGHPIPDDGSARGANEIVRIAEKADKKDLVIVCITGGCTSLTMLPPKGISLEDARMVSSSLLRSGAPIEDMNTVRKHLSQIGGGKLAMLAHPAEIVALIAVDEVAGLAWGPTVPDTTTFLDATQILKRYNLWDKIPKSVANYFERALASEETPKATDFEQKEVKVHNLIFAKNSTLCEAAQKKAVDLGMNGVIISTSIEGEAKDVAKVLASIAQEIEKNKRPFDPPCVVVAGGETTVSIAGEPGEGGRNQELALASALKISGSEKIVIASLGTDGTDGPTDIAGGVVDGYTFEEARKSGIDPYELLAKHDSSSLFRRLGNAIYTYDTGTNLMDLIIVCVN